MKYIISLILLISSIYANDIKFESKEEKVNLIELYTSQGCSSCPPADKWLSKLKNHPKLFKDFIPLAFHVTYWDFIGWKDVFANKLNDNRQRYYSSRVWKKNSVYTPQFIINAKEYRKWFEDQSFPNLDNSYGGKLKVHISNNIARSSYFNKLVKDEKVFLNIAILGFSYSINIKKGENKYKTLEHDFVVLEHIQKFANIKDNKLNLDIKIPKIDKDNKTKAIAVWISDKNSKILQATGAYIY